MGQFLAIGLVTKIEVEKAKVQRRTTQQQKYQA